MKREMQLQQESEPISNELDEDPLKELISNAQRLPEFQLNAEGELILENLTDEEKELLGIEEETALEELYLRRNLNRIAAQLALYILPVGINYMSNLEIESNADSVFILTGLVALTLTSHLYSALKVDKYQKIIEDRLSELYAVVDDNDISTQNEIESLLSEKWPYREAGARVYQLAELSLFASLALGIHTPEIIKTILPNHWAVVATLASTFVFGGIFAGLKLYELNIDEQIESLSNLNASDVSKKRRLNIEEP